MPSKPRQQFFHHSEDWTTDHAALVSEPATWGSLAFQGLIVDTDGHLREQRCCPACQSTIVGPPTSLRRIHDSLRQHSQVVHLSLQFLADVPADLEAMLGPRPVT